MIGRGDVSEFGDVSSQFRFDLADSQIRGTAFAAAKELAQANGTLTSEQLRAGFQFQGKRIPFINPQRGIFKPKEMNRLLSIRTVFPRSGARIWYDDQREAHQQIFNGEETVDYAFMGTDPDAAENRWLRDAFDLRTPIIYFLGTAPGLYQPIIPTFIVGMDPAALKARIAFSPADVSMSDMAVGPPQTGIERRYGLRLVKQRLHQAAFREMVITAYRGRCAISGLPQPSLLDAAHIVNDRDEELGQPLINNGITLSKLHHAAYDTNLIGIDADARIHVSERLLMLKDGPTLEALRQFDGKLLMPPVRDKDKHDRDRLAIRFERFKAAA
jgi:putative restriction endonuclease